MNLFDVHIGDHCLAVEFHRPFHARGGWSGQREQSFDKAAGVFGVEADDFPPGHDFLRRFPRVDDDEGCHRAPFERGGFLKNAFVRARDPRDEPLGFWLWCFDWHRENVCLTGTQIKS